MKFSIKNIHFGSIIEWRGHDNRIGLTWLEEEFTEQDFPLHNILTMLLCII